MALLLMAVVTEGGPAREPEETFDRYGGIKSIRATETGWFHAERIDGRDFLVTPEGHGFFALGINHIPAIPIDRLQRQWAQ